MKSNIILLSIKPEYIDKIFNGTKRFEYRKTKFEYISRVIMYSTSPVKRIVGEFRVKNILYYRVNKIWHLTKDYSGVSKNFFFKYFEKYEFATAFSIGQVLQYDAPLNPYELLQNFTPPQSFRYIMPQDLKILKI